MQTEQLIIQIMAVEHGHQDKKFNPNNPKEVEKIKLFIKEKVAEGWHLYGMKAGEKDFEQIKVDQIEDKDKQLVKAKEKSEKLLKEWLSPDEYNGLVLQGEIEIHSKIDDDTIFIVKRDPNQMVEVKKAGNYSHRLCLISKDGDFPVGDQLLSKLALLKTDEKKFREIAIRHG